VQRQSGTIPLVFALQRLSPHGGQEYATHALMTRLAAKGWPLTLVCIDCDDWPTGLPLTIHRIPCPRWLPQLFRNLWFLMVSHRVLHRLSSPALVVTAGTAAWRTDIRVVHFVHQRWWDIFHQFRLPLPNAQGPLRRAYQWFYAAWERFLERLILRRCRALVAVSQSVAADLRHYLPASQHPQVVVIPHAAEPNHIRAAHELRSPARPITQLTPVKILFVGSLERKGIGKALEILAACRDLPWEFTAVGGGAIDRWQQQAAALGLSDRIRFTGHQAAAPYFSQADIFLFPSTYEPFGLVITEAISAGCLPLASSECGALDLWPQRPDWMKLSFRDTPGAWADALRLIINDATLRHQLTRQAQTAVSAWTWDHACDSYEKLFWETVPS